MELGDIALGFVMLTIGLGSASLAALYWQIGGLTLLSFGLFAFLYGIQSLLLSPSVAALVDLPSAALLHVVSMAFYWLPVPGLIFLEQVLESGTWPLFRRLWQGWCVLALACMAHDLAVGPGASAFIYRNFFVVALVVVILARFAWRGLPRTRERRVLTIGFTVFMLGSLHDILTGLVLVPWNLQLANSGLSIFILALGYVTSQQFFSAQRELATMEYELQTASTIQSSLLPHGTPPVPGLDIAVRYEPMRTIGGDMYDFVVDGRQLGVLVADVTGHGVPAALIASMVKVAFSSQAAAAASPGQLIAGMNRALCGQFRGQFVTATYMHIDPASHLVRYTNAGHPPPFLWRAATRQAAELAGAGAGVLMGFDSNVVYTTGEAHIEDGDRLVLYTDGVLEVADGSGEFFGSDGLKAFVESHEALPAEEFADALLAHLRERTSRRGEGRGFEDDVTLVVVDVHEPAARASLTSSGND